jgi:hypothetical protein
MSYCIQRGDFKDRPEKQGIDSIVSFQYMGSSEYEWGALPKSLEAIRKNIENYSCYNIIVGDKIITLFCIKGKENDIKKVLSELALGKVRLKEPSFFDLYIYPQEDRWGRTEKTDFWWDIDEHFMFWGQNNDFYKKFVYAICRSHL